MKGVLTLLFFCRFVWAQIDLTDPQEVACQLVSGNYHEPCELSVLKLFDLESDFFQNLAQEVRSLFVFPNQKKIVLLNRTGKFYDTSSDHDWSICKKKFFHANRYPHIAYLISLFPHAINFRAMRMAPHSQLFQHDENICLRHRVTEKPCLRVRFHLPIKTHPEAVMFMAGNLYNFEEGSIYFFHNGRIHDALNQHPDQERIHLVWDILLTEDTFERMFKRSIEMPMLLRIEDPSMAPVAKGEIDPSALKRPRIFSYEDALLSTLCPVQ